MIIWPSWGDGLVFNKPGILLFNYSEKYSNEVINLSRGMLIFWCSVSTVLKKHTCLTKLPPNALDQDRVWDTCSSGFPQAPGNTWLKTMKVIWSSLQWMYFYQEEVSQGWISPKFTQKVTLHCITPLPPLHHHRTYTHINCSGIVPRENMGWQFNLNFR